jgi:hypothetical protein
VTQGATPGHWTGLNWSATVQGRGGPPRPSTGDAKIGRAQSEIGEIKHGQRCLTSGRSSGWLGAVSGELDGRGSGRGSPAASGGVGRARERAELCEMRRGSECGHGRGSKRELGRVGGRRGREFRRCARVRTRRSMAGAGRAELIGRVHGVEREKRGAQAMAQRLAERAREIEREE